MYSKISQKRKGNKDKDVLPINQYLIDNATNISTLPTQTSKPIYERCGAGSTALCVGDKNYYILNNNNNWVFYKQIENVPEEIVSAFADFSDRLKKGIDNQGQIVAGAIAEGYNTTASGINSHAEGSYTAATGANSHAEGNSTQAVGNKSHAEGENTTANGQCSHAEGSYTTASGDYSHAEGSGARANGRFSHAEGYGTIANDESCHAEGSGAKANGRFSHAEGYNTTASGFVSHAEGSGTAANSQCSHAEGYGTIASGFNSHAEGYETTASGPNSHTEGESTTASGFNSHAEGYETIANGGMSHAGGWDTTANGTYSYAFGRSLIANGEASYVIGKFNTEMQSSQADNYAFIVGNGTFDLNTNEATRSNAFAVKWDGTFVLANGTEISPSQMTALLSNSGNNNNNSTSIVEMTLNNSIYTLNKTWKEIKDAFSSGCVIIHFDNENEYEHSEYWYPITKIIMAHDNEDPAYFIYFDTYELLTTNENGYPSYDRSQ